MCLVASPERSARRCTSSATTVKPLPASPADAAWMAAFSASTLVCSVTVSYTHLRAHETPEHLVCRLLLEKKKKKNTFFFFLMIRRPPRSTLDRSSAASDVYKRQGLDGGVQRQHVGLFG